ncbi:MAG: UDP-4-amino-4,6-dideoxy-N-acetyl-beta-L-altrosamine N-acetyltransferase [Candidatus Omnitrophica bacterium]|nr:UDP-4-amino-4,6-dideoxy-N-acetyl-beta-L-altrosamine N-acetyltransferase [Candidatus Omnitrophota bacterium]
MHSVKFVDILKVDPETKQRVRYWRNKEHIRRCMIGQEIISEEEHNKWLTNLGSDLRIKFWIVFSEDTPIGAVYLNDIDYEKKISDWGFYIGEDTYLGKGLGKAVLYKFLDLAFSDMDMDYLTTLVLTDNDRAIGLYRKFGFKEKRLSIRSEDDISVMELSKKEWKVKREELENLLRGKDKR